VKKIIERLLLKKKSKNLVLVLFVDWMEADLNMCCSLKKARVLFAEDDWRSPAKSPERSRIHWKIDYFI